MGLRGTTGGAGGEVARVTSREALTDKSPLTPLRLQWREAFDANAQQRQLSLRIYTLDGRYVGSDASLLPSGIYVSGGRKFLKD